MFITRRKYCSAVMALILGGSFLSACTSNDDGAAATPGDSTEASTTLNLTVPQGTAPEHGWPLLVVAGTDGERIAEVIPEDDPAVLLRLPDGVSTAEAAEEIFSAREGNDITDTRVWVIHDARGGFDNRSASH